MIIAKYIDVRVHRRSYLIWPPVIGGDRNTDNFSQAIITAVALSIKKGPRTGRERLPSVFLKNTNVQ